MNNRKKILVFIDWYLPGFKAGGPIRSCAALVHHLKVDVDFFIVTRDTDYCETTPYPNIASNQWNKISEGENVYYISDDKLNIHTIKKIIVYDQFSMVYINGIYSIYFSILPLYFSKKFNQPIIVAPRGMLAKSAIEVKGLKKNLFIAASKILNPYRNVMFHSTSVEESKDILHAFGKNSTVTYAPNLTILGSKKFVKREKKIGALRLINVARISPEKNLLYALEILIEMDQEILFDIYGPIYDADYWNKCKEVINKLPPNIKVHTHGAIENKLLASKLEVAHLLLMPTRGENFGHIIAESLAAGCPVVISDQTPWQQLEDKMIGWDIPLLNRDKFKDVIKRCVLMNHEQYENMSFHSFTFAEKILNDNNNLELNKSLFNL